ncbi:MAG TPA: tRNA dimethylallyltransferase, partial [Saprospiraceae bacterium]|nr:tRNA dimethylallyltransferase [Saprospiraceae bacterium]
AVLSGLDDLPASTPEIKSEMQQRFQELGLEGIQNLLKQWDPEYYHQVDVSNARRILRALEVIAMTGKPYSALRSNPQRNHEWNIREVTLFPERELLYERINQRVDRMMEAGLLEEARALIAYREMQALNTVGYQELFDYMDGRISLDEAVGLIKQHTRNYAKRQMTWFNKESRGIRLASGDEKEMEEYLEE